MRIQILKSILNRSHLTSNILKKNTNLSLNQQLAG